MDFFEKLYISLHLIMRVKILTNFLFFIAGTRTFVEALRALKRLERSIGFTYQDKRGHFWFRRHLRGILFVTVLTVCAWQRGVTVTDVTRDLPPTMTLLLKVLSMVFSLYYGFITAMAAIIEKYFCVVLAHYVKFLVARTKGQLLKLPAFVHHTEDVANAVDRLRANYHDVTMIVRDVDNWLRYAVVINFLCSALIGCVVAYAAFDSQASREKFSLTALYAALTFMVMVDASLSTGDLKTEARNLKELLESASLLRLPPRLSCQVELFNMTIDEKQLCFTGSGFFTVDRPMLTSYVALVMTYSLLLIQTGRKSEAPEC
ncbi:hypothetical protein V5799_015843 [Amblyomma americanum]|uniref:Gustatory receptor n=1 Tax=Amblyomma americanum TaxID=6943 RepID=A0AAQ4F6P0_AMBAM